MHDLRGRYECVVFHLFNLDDDFMHCYVILLVMIYVTNVASA